jgi:hypothetical protein
MRRLHRVLNSFSHRSRRPRLCRRGAKRGKFVGADGQNTNAAENFFGIFKRGMFGTYHKCEEQHLQRYVTEFEFRFNNRTALGVNDKMRAETLLKQIEGKRLTYRRPN